MDRDETTREQRAELLRLAVAEHEQELAADVAAIQREQIGQVQRGKAADREQAEETARADPEAPDIDVLEASARAHRPPRNE